MRLVLATLFLAGAAAQAQTGSIHGRVLDVQERPLQGATVQIEGTTLGAISGPDGMYTIASVPVGAQILVARYIGYKMNLMADVADAFPISASF